MKQAQALQEAASVLPAEDEVEVRHVVNHLVNTKKGWEAGPVSRWGSFKARFGFRNQEREAEQPFPCLRDAVNHSRQSLAGGKGPFASPCECEVLCGMRSATALRPAAAGGVDPGSALPVSCGFRPGPEKGRKGPAGDRLRNTGGGHELFDLQSRGKTRSSLSNLNDLIHAILMIFLNEIFCFV